MGSLSSRPSIPAQPRTIVVSQPASPPNPAPAPAPAPTPSSASASQGTSTPAPAAPEPATPSPEEQASDQRKENLLTRSRSRLGTVKTSFRGLLQLANSTDGRKTLLGE